ncbi:MAG: hypothetical protein ACYSUD_20545 [Planctomycetota bacterium]|jgi:hypothetical protein
MRLDSKLVGILLLAILIGAPRLVRADFRVVKVGDSLVDAEALGRGSYPCQTPICGVL